MFSTSTLFTEAMKWPKPLISHKIATCLFVMLFFKALSKSVFHLILSSTFLVNRVSNTTSEMRKWTQNGSHLKLHSLLESAGKQLHPPQCSARDTRLWTVGIGFPSLKAPGTGLAHSKLLPSYSSLLPQCLEQYLVNGWMNNEWVNNNEWMDEGVAELREALTHTSAL